MLRRTREGRYVRTGLGVHVALFENANGLALPFYAPGGRARARIMSEEQGETGATGSLALEIG